jgi:hypothetical protein
MNVVNQLDQSPESRYWREHHYADIVRDCPRTYDDIRGDSKISLPDMAFSMALQSEGIKVRSLEEAISHARSVCDVLKRPGAAFIDPLEQVQKWYPDLSVQQAGFFQGAAVTAYCGELSARFNLPTLRRVQGPTQPK